MSQINMTLEQSESFHSVEAVLVSSLNIDIDNSVSVSKFLNKTMCHATLIECVCPKYCISIYDQFIYPVYCYIEYINNFLTFDRFALWFGVADYQAKDLIECGKQILDVKHSLLNQGK